jgi:uncharacterized membrane protein
MYPGLHIKRLSCCCQPLTRAISAWLLSLLQVKARTSVMPFAAIADGRQQLPKDYYKEFLRAPYIAVTAFTLGAYLCHPLMQQASYSLHW